MKFQEWKGCEVVLVCAFSFTGKSISTPEPVAITLFEGVSMHALLASILYPDELLSCYKQCHHLAVPILRWPRLRVVHFSIFPSLSLTQQSAPWPTFPLISFPSSLLRLPLRLPQSPLPDSLMHLLILRHHHLPPNPHRVLQPPLH